MLIVKRFIEQHLNRLLKNFQVEKDIWIVLRPLPKRRTAGRHTLHQKIDRHKIELDITAPLRSCIRTLFHELTHAEQHETGRLRHEWNGRYWDRVWNGVNHGRNKSFGQTSNHLAKYQNQPWERDANDRMYYELDLLEQELGSLDTYSVEAVMK
jgi:hypothetical protein